MRPTALPAIFGWYLFQIDSRRKGGVRYKLRLIAVYLRASFPSVYILKSQGIPETQAAIFSILIGFGVALILFRPPKESRRIPKAIRRAVIARDLESKGLKWDPEKYHIDHKVPFS